MAIGKAVVHRNGFWKPLSIRPLSFFDRELRKPMTGIALCWALARSGRPMAAPPSSQRKSRRFMIEFKSRMNAPSVANERVP
jgi:hypothetical protein